MSFRSIRLAGLAIIVAVSFPLSAFSAEKAPKASSQTNPAQAIADFGVSDIEVKSVKKVDTGNLNTKVTKAASKGEAWCKDAVLVALEIAGARLKGNTKIIEVLTPPEQREEVTITITETGYLDDAVSGERWRLWLKKGADGAWTIQRALWAQLCARPGRTFYAAEKCP